MGIVRLGKHLSTVAHVELAIPIARVSLRRCFIFHDLHSFLRHTVEWRKQRRCWRCNIFQAQSGNRLCYKYSAAKARCGSPFIAACICVWCMVCVASSFWGSCMVCFASSSSVMLALFVLLQSIRSASVCDCFLCCYQANGCTYAIHKTAFLIQ